MGGLGNYLFQIAAGYSKSLDLGEKFVINPNNVQVVHKPLTFYTDNILKKITLDSNFNTNQVYYEPVFYYSPIPDFMLPTYLHGYFQSEKYFKNNREKILDKQETQKIQQKLILLGFSFNMIESVMYYDLDYANNIKDGLNLKNDK